MDVYKIGRAIHWMFYIFILLCMSSAMIFAAWESTHQSTDTFCTIEKTNNKKARHYED